MHSRVRETAAAAGASLLAQALLGVLVDLTGRGTHAASCGRLRLGIELAKAAGGLRAAYSVRHVARCLAELTALGLISTRRRWSPDFAEPLPAYRYLTPKLLGAVADLARQRASKRQRKRWRAAEAEAEAENRPTPPAFTSGKVVGCSACHLQDPDHLPGCPNAPPAK